MSSFPSGATSSPVGSINVSALDLAGQFARRSNNSERYEIATRYIYRPRKKNLLLRVFARCEEKMRSGRRRKNFKKKKKKGEEAAALTHAPNAVQNKAIGKKSVEPGINKPSPQMPSIVPCLDKVSKSGWKMQAPFLSVWNYYPFVSSQAALSCTS